MQFERIIISLILLYFFGFSPHTLASRSISPNTVVTTAYMNLVPDAICPNDPVKGYSYITYTHIGFPLIPQGVWFRSELDIKAKKPNVIKYINVPEKPFERDTALVLSWATGKYRGDAWVYEYSKIVLPGQSGHMEVVYKTTGYEFYRTYYEATGTGIHDWPITDSDEFITYDPGFCSE